MGEGRRKKESGGSKIDNAKREKHKKKETKAKAYTIRGNGEKERDTHRMDNAHREGKRDICIPLCACECVSFYREKLRTEKVERNQIKIKIAKEKIKLHGLRSRCFLLSMRAFVTRQATTHKEKKKLEEKRKRQDEKKNKEAENSKNQTEESSEKHKTKR